MTERPDFAQAMSAVGLDPGDIYFDPKAGLKVASLAHDVARQVGPFALAPDDTLWRYLDGVYRRDGEHVVREVVADRLGERFRESHLRNVVLTLKARARVRLPGGTDWPDDTYLNLTNGLLDWRNGTLHPHTPDLPTMVRIPHAWEPDATCPAFRSWVESTFDAPDEMVPFLGEVLGAVLHQGRPFHQRAFMPWGGGKNGKGVFTDTAAALVGAHNVTSVAPQKLDSNRFAAAELYGKVANIVGDVSAEAFTNTEQFKAATGGDLLFAERKYGQPFNFRSFATMVASFNTLPGTVDKTEGFFRRWLVIPFTYEFVDGITDAQTQRQRDPGVVARLTTPDELTGLLVLAVDGLRRLYQRGDFDPPAPVLKATARYREYADPVLRFLVETVEPSPDLYVPRSEMYERYSTWCMEEGHKPVSASRFYEEVPRVSRQALGSPLLHKTVHGQRRIVGGGLKAVVL